MLRRVAALTVCLAVLCGPAAATTADVPTAVTYLTASLNGYYHASKKVGGLGYSVARTQQTNVYKALVALGGAWPTPTPNVDCFAAPGACGYPDPAYGNVGVPAGTALTSSGSLTITTAGATVQDMEITGTLTVDAANVTVKDTMVIGSGGSGSFAVRSNSTGLTIEDSTITGAGPNSPQAVEMAVGFGGATILRSVLTDCGECVNGGGMVVEDSYVEVTPGSMAGEHYEDVYTQSGATLIHDTLLNPQSQTAVLFGDTYTTGGVCQNQWTVENNLIAGGGYTFYTCGNASSSGASEATVTGNRFANCATSSVYQASGNGIPVGDAGSLGAGGHTCSGGQDGYGYWPGIGYYGLDAYTYCDSAHMAWTGNVRDGDNTAVSC